MFVKKYGIQVIVYMLLIMALLTVGCTNNNDNQMRQQGTPNLQGNMDQRILVADQAAVKIVSLNGVQQANVLVTQRNAFVAAVLDDDQDQLSGKIENQIAKQVRATDPKIRNVYVSTNPDFVKRVNRYVDEVQQGRPVAGFVEEFNEMVQRIFPNAR
ncbi:MAG TPA: YhcN/YlaJ family sporulation lipoprotein [Bacilli bacterium]